MQIALQGKLMFAGTGGRSNKIKQIYKGKAAMRRVTAFSVLWLL